MSFLDLEGGAGGNGRRGGGGGGMTAGLMDGVDSASSAENAELIQEQIQLYARSVRSVSQLSARLGRKEDTPEHRQSMHREMERAETLAAAVTQQLKAFAGRIASAPGSRQNDQQRMRQRKMLKDFQAQVGLYESVVKEALAKERQHVAQARRSRDESLSSGGELDAASSAVRPDRGLSEEETANLLAQRQFVAQEVMFNDHLIAEREEDVAAIAGRVDKVKDIFQDLAGMVDDQGAMVDTIDGTVTAARDKAVGGVGQLDQAARYQAASRRKLCCCLGLLGVLIAIVLIIVLAHH